MSLPGRDAVLALADPLSLPDRLTRSKAGFAQHFRRLSSADDCIDQLPLLDLPTREELDTIKVPETDQCHGQEEGQEKTVTKPSRKTITKFVDEDFTVEGPAAAEKVGMALPENVIGGMDRPLQTEASTGFFARWTTPGLLRASRAPSAMTTGNRSQAA